MRTHQLLLPLGATVLLATSATAQLNIVNNLPGTFVDISATGTPLSLTDDGEVDIATTIGNALLPAGTVRVGSNGGVRFNGAGQELGFTNGALPNAGVFSLTSQALLPFWDDINTVGGTVGEIYWQETMGMLIVQWHDVGFFGGGATDTARFQLQVPSTGSTWARFVYSSVSNPRPNQGGSATIGYQAGGWGTDVVFSQDTPGAVMDNTVLSLVGTFTPPPPPPANDDCAGAVTLALNTPVAFDCTWATSGSVPFTCVAGENDVWYRYTATSNNRIGIDTCGSASNTLLEVFTGTCGNLTSLRCNNDSCGTASAVVFAGTPGTTYLIHVGGTVGNAGQGTIQVTETASANVTIVSNLPGTWIDISSSGTPLNLTDDAEVDIPTTIGNSVLPSGIARVGSNGGVRFTGAALDLAFTNANIPSTTAFGGEQTLLAFWDDFNTASGTIGNIYYQETQGRLIIQWQDAGFFGAAAESATFQIQVFSGTSPAFAQFLYQNVSGARAANGGSATVGYQAGNLIDDFEWSFNNPVIMDNSVLSLVLGSGGLGTPYCQANPNSTGATGVLTAAGSSVVAQNDVTLHASSLPVNSFGFFLTSRTQGFTPMPGGSQGNLCLASPIGRYVGPGQIKNSGAMGEFSLQINLPTMPQPLGAVAAAAGDTWNFQAWHRDVSGGVPVSNFTRGLSIQFQ